MSGIGDAREDTHAVADRESRAAPQAGAIPPWPSPPIARNLPRPLSLFLPGKQAYPALSSVRSLGLIRISLLFDTGAFRCAGFRIAPAFPLRARPRGEPWRLGVEGHGGYVHARTMAATTIGADRVADRSGSKAACASPTDAGLAAPACSGTRHPLQNLGLPACPERSYRNPVGQEYTLC